MIFGILGATVMSILLLHVTVIKGDKPENIGQQRSQADSSNILTSSSQTGKGISEQSIRQQRIEASVGSEPVSQVQVSALQRQQLPIAFLK